MLDAHFLPTLLTVADPRKGNGYSEAFIFWICLVCVLATFFLALTDKLDGTSGVFATSTALIFGYYLGGQRKVQR